MVVIGGFAVVLLVPLTFVALRRRPLLAPVAAAALALAAVAAATAPGDWLDAWGPDGDLVTVLALVGVATVAASLASDRGAPDPPSADDEVATGS
jgi:arabinofuranan 3-O-arabinosyltransferase